MINRQEVDWSQQLFLYSVATEWFLYGIHVVLFYSCVKTLGHCRVRHKVALYLAISAIFLLCTVHGALQLVNAGELLTVLERDAGVNKGSTVVTNALMKRRNQINIVMGAIYVTSNLIADGIFIYRCYCIWDFRYRIIAAPIILLIATGCLGYTSVIASALDGFFRIPFC
ncbi:hypothetical protein MVEN_00284900 [Mycena venus]|uniref:Uncharacterized protein n=1 Tax=Mycena venus TaxID=2733690 RepID=A0A8H7DCP4_9AGAR|nr:hypothetical protein MVEN_00284900 [Mycena venus]